MKLKYISFVAFAMTLSLSSCYDLNRFPGDQLSNEKFYRNEEHAKEAMMAVYNQMQKEDVFGLQFAMDGLGASQWDMIRSLIRLYREALMT